MEDTAKYDGPVGPIVGSILVIVGWLLFILFYALYWSKAFDLFQNIIVTIVSLAIGALVIGVLWLIWYNPSGELRSKYRHELPAR
jgi:hypothetical protein